MHDLARFDRHAFERSEDRLREDTEDKDANGQRADGELGQRGEDDRGFVAGFLPVHRGDDTQVIIEARSDGDDASSARNLLFTAPRRKRVGRRAVPGSEGVRSGLR